MITSALLDLMARMCGDPDMTRNSRTVYLNASNLAQNQFAMETRSLWKDTTWTSVADTARYSFSSASPVASDFMFEENIYFNGLLLIPTSRRDMAILSPDSDWTLTTGTPTRVIVDPEEANKGILVYPIPTANDAGKTIAMRYFPLPVALSSDSDTPLNSSALMAQFHIGLASYGAWIVLGYETATNEIRAKRADLLAAYADIAAKATDLFKNTASAPWRLRGSRHV